MHVPDDLHYTADHEWARVEGNRVRIGITDYAQDALGDVVFVQLPEPGTAVTAGTSMSEVESTKSVSEIYAPLGGTVVARNEALEATPELINGSPFGDGWIFALEPFDAGGLDGLLDAAAYQGFVSEA